MLKCSSERWVCAPHSLSAGTSTTPRLSVSLRISVICDPSSFMLTIFQTGGRTRGREGRCRTDPGKRERRLMVLGGHLIHGVHQILVGYRSRRRRGMDLLDQRVHLF